MMICVTLGVLGLGILVLLAYAAGQDVPPSDRPAEPGERADDEH